MAFIEIIANSEKLKPIRKVFKLFFDICIFTRVNVPFRALDRTSYMFNHHKTDGSYSERSRVHSFRLVVCLHRKLPSPEGNFGELASEEGIITGLRQNIRLKFKHRRYFEHP